jgi:hypothetical protein
MTSTVLPGQLHPPNAAHGNTFRKRTSWAFPVANGPGAFGRGFVQPRNAKNTGGNLRNLNAFALLVTTGFTLPRSLHSFTG